MNVYPVSETTEYKGCGLALAAIKDGKAIELRYLYQICPEYDCEDKANDWLVWGKDPRVGAAMKELERRGFVSVGICSCGEFCEL